MYDVKWGGDGYDAYAGYCQSKPSNAAKQGYSNSVSDRNVQSAADASQDTALGKEQSTLDYYNGPPDQSPLYKTLLTTGTESTNRAYDNAKAATTSRAHMAGFGYEQPIAQGANSELESERASDLSRVPREALTASIGPNLQAAGLESGIGSQYGARAGQRGGQSLGYFNTAAGAEQSDIKRKQAMYEALAQAAAAPFTMGG